MRATIFLVLAFAATACSRSNDNGMAFGDVGPEQSTFFVTPAEPLAIPPTTALPQPTPGGTNRATR